MGIEKQIAEEVVRLLVERGMVLGGPKIQPRLMTVAQAGEYLGRSKDGVRRLIESGKLKTIRHDRRVFLDVRDLDQAIEDAKK